MLIPGLSWPSQIQRVHPSMCHLNPPTSQLLHSFQHAPLCTLLTVPIFSRSHRNPFDSAPASRPRPPFWTDYPHNALVDIRIALPPKDKAQNPPTHPINHQQHDDNDTRQLQHGHFITLFRHAGQSARGPANIRAHIAEHFIRVVERLLRPRVVVDVQCDMLESRGLLGERGEEGIVLSACSRLAPFLGTNGAQGHLDTKEMVQETWGEGGKC